MIEAVNERSFVYLSELVAENSDWFNQQRDTYGAILFRGFELETTDCPQQAQYSTTSQNSHRFRQYVQYSQYEASWVKERRFFLNRL